MADARQKISQMKSEANTAFMNARAYHAELKEIYRWYMPFRQPVTSRSDTGDGNEGNSRTNHLFDGTGLSSAFTFAGQMQADWIPPHGNFFTLDPGPLVPSDLEEQLRPILQDVTRRVHGVLPRVHDCVHEMFIDLFAGTGALLVNPGTARYPVMGRAVPVIEMAMEEGPHGDIWRRWWRRKWQARQIPEIWPDAKISNRLAQLVKNAPEAPVEVTQATVWRPKEKIWDLVAWTDQCDSEGYLWQEDLITSPWITPRFFKVPGESMGRGLAHLGLPFVKTANKTRELALTAAAFAVMGLWVRRNDGVFNPDLAELAPGKMWTVQSTGGPLGPSISRLPIPQDFNVASIVMQDERDQIRKVLLDDELPDQQDPVRSATEIAGRLSRYARLKGGAGSRLSYELVTALVERVIEILARQNYLPNLPHGLNIDQLITKVTITAPAAASQRSGDVERVVNWIQMVTMLLGPQAAMLAAKVEDLVPQMGRWLGVEEQFIRDKGERKQLMEIVAQMAAQQQAAASQAAAKPPTANGQANNAVSGVAA